LSMRRNVATQLQKPGAVGVIPTDTVYGIVARAVDPFAVKRLYGIKKRSHKPGTVIAASLKQLESLGLKHRYLKAVQQFWPGAVSVIIPVSGAELAYLHQGKHSLAVRIPVAAELQTLLSVTGPLLTSSANQPGKPTAVNIEQAKAYFGDQVDFYDDGGDLSDRQVSTLIRIVDDAVEVLRQGSTKV
jgi:L-threonylcarbamoyladenylate synthase